MDGFTRTKAFYSRIVQVLFLLVCGSTASGAQELCDTVTATAEVYFRTGYSFFQPDYRNNSQAVETAVTNVAWAMQTDPGYRIVITGSTSPDGTYSNNTRLAAKRTYNIAGMFSCELEQRGMGSELSHISSQSAGIDWEGLACMTDTVQADWAGEMSDILRNCPIYTFSPDGSITGGKFQRMHGLDGGRPYFYMKENLFPGVRKVRIDVISVVRKEAQAENESEEAQAASDSIPESVTQSDAAESAADSVAAPDSVPQSVPESVQTALPVPATEQTRTYEMKKFMAVKTNLAFDLATVVNAEIEFPVAGRYSLNVEYDGPWWLIEQSEGSYCLMANVVQIEGRYWFPRRNSTRDIPLNGFFAGVYGGTGRYDIQNYAKGWRGDFWNMGLGGGYSTALTRHLNLEFELGLGLMSTQYETYAAKRHNTILAYQDTRRTMLFYPGRAHVSLVWNLFVKRYSR